MFSDRAEKRLKVAREDIRKVHALLLGMLERHAERGWEQARVDGWSPAEVCLHLLLSAERALAGLQACQVPGSGRKPELKLWRSLEKWRLLLTWRVAQVGLRDPQTQPQGVILTPQILGCRSTSWAADFLQFLSAQPAPWLAQLTYGHARLGPLTFWEWARFLRIYALHLDLRLQEKQN